MKSPTSTDFTTTLETTLVVVKTSSLCSTLVIKPPIHSLSASTNRKTRTIKTTITSTISPARSSPNSKKKQMYLQTPTSSTRGSLMTLDISEQMGSYGKELIGPLRSNRQVTYAGEQMRVDALAERDTEEDTYYIWTKSFRSPNPGT